MVRYRFRHTTPLLPVRNQVRVFHTPQSYFFEIHFIVILLSTPRSSRWSFSYRFPTKYLCAFVFSSRHTTRPSALILVGLFNLITFGEGCNSRSFSSHYFFHPPATVPSSVPNIHSAPCSRTSSADVLPLIRENNKHAQILVLLVLIFMILHST